jgi:hypothetical protein
MPIKLSATKPQLQYRCNRFRPKTVQGLGILQARDSNIHTAITRKSVEEQFLTNEALLTSFVALLIKG